MEKNTSANNYSYFTQVEENEFINSLENIFASPIKYITETWKPFLNKLKRSTLIESTKEIHYEFNKTEKNSSVNTTYEIQVGTATEEHTTDVEQNAAEPIAAELIAVDQMTVDSIVVDRMAVETIAEDSTTVEVMPVDSLTVDSIAIGEDSQSLQDQQESHDFSDSHCSICQKSFIKKAWLIAHEKRHSSRIYNQHRKEKNTKLNNTTDNEQSLYCIICEKGFTAPSYIIHNKKYHGVKTRQTNVGVSGSSETIRCLKCNKRFSSEELCLHHTKKHHGSSNEQQKSRLKRLNKHASKTLSTDSEDSTDQESSVVVIKNTAAKVLSNIHLPSSITSSMKESNQATINESRSSKCRLCDSYFASKEILSLHLKEMHYVNKKEGRYEYQCELCKKKFNSLKTIDKHIREVHPFIVQKGIESFTDDTNATKAVDNNENSVIFKVPKKSKVSAIDEIGKGIQDTSLMTPHVTETQTTTSSTATINEATEFYCMKCSSHFPTKADLHIHNKDLHPFVSLCTKCKPIHTKLDAMYYQHLITNHEMKVRWELEDSIYCSFCTKSFASVETYARHSKLKHGNIIPNPKNEQLFCTACIKTFPSQIYYTSHLEKKHDFKFKISLVKEELHFTYKYENNHGGLKRQHNSSSSDNTTMSGNKRRKIAGKKYTYSSFLQ